MTEQKQPPAQQIDEPLLTFKEAMNYLKVSRSTMYRLLNSGELHGFKIGNGRHWKFTLSQLQGVLK